MTVSRLVTVVSVTKKGQATIPKELRGKYGIKDKVLIEEEEGKIVLKPVPTPSQDFSLTKNPLQRQKLKRITGRGQKRRTDERQED